ncbi:Pr6Pr family membrane protein [Afipia sp. P52-10]|uniref:Pr6Pr family membrane protein n=1 Tax=Afipia sp. P52-10 TaxID=1429916 RepID=UPI0004B90AC8|nr:Pr6Pr family membrane protein [Afipia sp. P52-10]
MTTTVERVTAGALALVAWGALVLQYGLLLQAAGPLGLSVGEATVRFFSYFTIHANVLAALMLTALALRTKANEWTVHPFERSAVATYIAVVMLVYLGVLQSLWAPRGAQWLADMLLHYALPLAYLAVWLWVMRKAGLRWYDPLLWLIYPAFYLAFVLVRGRWSGFYPYPFLDVGRLGYGQVALNVLALIAVFVVAGFAILLASRLLARREPV